MKRLELFEFEDFNWLPSTLRAGVTSLIIVLHKQFGTSAVIAQLIEKLHQKHPFSQITDLGSGSGGPMIDTIQTLNKKRETTPINLLLTDLYPNPKTVAEINNRRLPNTQYHDSPVDATNISQAPKGLKTMIASFHHMSPPTAQKILQSAQNNKQPILIYEIAKNNIPFIIWLLFLPLSLLILIVMALGMTLFVRPLSFRQIVFTYLIPIIPLIYAWDGQASLMRTYTFDDIKTLIGNTESDSYEWSIADAQKADGKKLGYYIIGHPK